MVLNFHRAGYTSNNLVYDGSTFSFDLSTSSSADFRAPIFYDLNNTGYYANPNGISNFSTILGESIQVQSTSPSLVIQDTDSSGAAQVGFISFRNTSGTETAWTGFGGSSNTDFSVINTLGRIYLNGTYTEATNSLRAPIFYDSNNTGYYVDPASTSNINNLVVTGTITGNITGNAGHLRTSYIGGQQLNPQTYFNSATGLKVAMTAVAGVWSDTLWINGYAGGDVLSMCALHTKRDGTPRMYISTQASNATSYGTLYEILSNYGGTGTYSTTGDFRAPIFYDSDNTAFYVDPASSSTLQTLNVNSFLSLFGGYGGGSGPGLAFENQSTFARMAFFGLDFYEWDYGNIGGINNGYIYSNTSLRAPIFYDSNNTSYYLNPADFSYVNSLEAITYISSANFYARSNTHVRNSADTAWNIVIQRNSGDNWIVYGGDSMRAPIFYDSNNTGYYVDPATISNLNIVQTAGYIYTSSYVQSASSMYSPIYYDGNNSAYYFDGSSTGDSIRCAGDIVAYYSDERLKDKKGNIENALEKVLALNGFYYEPNKKAQELGYKKKLEVGVSAQEVEAILPEIIKDAPIGQGYKTLDYGKLTPLLIEAIKEQQEQIQEQQKQIDELKELVNKLITK